MKVLKSVNLHLEYVLRCYKNQIQKKKVEHRLTSKTKYRHSSKHTWNEKVGKLFINYYYLSVKVKKYNGTRSVLMSNYVSDIANLPF